MLIDTEPRMTDSAVGTSNAFQVGIDTIAIIVGIFAVITPVRLIRKLGGRINQALRYFILGIVCNAVAIVWSLFSVIRMCCGEPISIHIKISCLSEWCFSLYQQLSFQS